MHWFAGLKTQLQSLFSSTADIRQAQVNSKLQEYGSPREECTTQARFLEAVNPLQDDVINKLDISMHLQLHIAISLDFSILPC